ncbi:sensor histidine kinase [Massilia sp. SM-13]|uniref:sensor histidine kinase n=1 Tax=Pseudoduganella rhizocola TaxID=3382643 RepID=UPI0038B48C7C
MAHRLADFIHDNMEAILQAWEDFARTIEPPALTMDDEALRDHARQMLLAFAADLGTYQTDVQRDAKAWGRGRRGAAETAAEAHAEARLLSGYTVVQLVSEYRALRSGVLSLWQASPHLDGATTMGDMTRFNEAVDQAVAESVARYQQLVARSQNMFLAILGHDLRNPLGTLVTGSHFIMQATDIPGRYADVAARMFRSAKRMSKLINDLIEFTRSHLGPGLPVQGAQADLAAVCEQVVNELRTFHPERGIELHLPPQLEARFDEARVAQMLSNLIGNAVQHGSGGPVRVDMSGGEHEVAIQIHNQGPAIPAEQIATIFEPMVRASSATGGDYTERTSLGIGLFIAREIAQAHGGQISVDSNERDGTSFTVTLPRGLAEERRCTS